LDHVTVDQQGSLSELGHVNGRSKAAPDQTLNFLGAAGQLHQLSALPLRR
jgi:hypothetical protein